MVVTFGHGLGSTKRPPTIAAVDLGTCATGPPHAQPAHPALPATALVVQVIQLPAAELSGRLQHDVDLGAALHRDDAPQQDGLVQVARKGQGLEALDDPGLGDPPGAPDQAAVFVVAAPDEPAGRGDRVDTAAADQSGEHGVRIPARDAHPDHLAARTHQSTAFPIGQHGVFAQHVRREGREGIGIGAGHGVCLPRARRGKPNASVGSGSAWSCSRCRVTITASR